MTGIYDGRRVLSNVTTTDAYTQANTLQRADAIRMTLIVANNAAIYQLGRGVSPNTQWGEEMFVPPSMGVFERIFDAIRVRSAAAGFPAQVTVEAVGQGDLGG